MIRIRFTVEEQAEVTCEALSIWLTLVERLASFTDAETACNTEKEKA